MSTGPSEIPDFQLGTHSAQGFRNRPRILVPRHREQMGPASTIRGPEPGNRRLQHRESNAGGRPLVLPPDTILGIPDFPQRRPSTKIIDMPSRPSRGAYVVLAAACNPSGPQSTPEIEVKPCGEMPSPEAANGDFARSGELQKQQIAPGPPSPLHCAITRHFPARSIFPIMEILCADETR